MPDRAVDRALVVVAHPDDAEFWAGGTIPLWTDASTEVTYCVLSDGEAGGFDPAMARSEIPQIRRVEQAEAAVLLGCTMSGSSVWTKVASGRVGGRCTWTLCG